MRHRADRHSVFYYTKSPRRQLLLHAPHIKKESQAKQEQAIVEHTSSMNDEALKELMYDAVERINVTDNHSIEIIWKFNDLFATA